MSRRRVATVALVATALLVAPAEGSIGPASTAPTEKRRPVGMPETRPPESGPLRLPAASTSLLVAVDRRPDALRLLRRLGASPVAASAGVWRASAAGARALARLGALRYAQTDSAILLANGSATAAEEPLDPAQWWLARVGAEGLRAPGPGVPLTIVDSGIDTGHPELGSRPGTRYLNPQSVVGERGHGTMVASVAAAPLDGVGLAGLYPEADLRSWDYGSGSCAAVVAGIERAVRTSRRGVVNLSGGFRAPSDCYPLYDVVAAAFGTGHVVVAAAGNDRDSGSPESFPASYPHVLTVAAGDRADAATGFSSEGLGIDLTAPGEEIPAAVPLAVDPTGYTAVSGTSFAAPMVAAAAAWAWTARRAEVGDVTQLFELVRASARDVGRVGWDADTGFGMLDLPALLTRPMPAADHSEPNDDVYQVKPRGLFRQAVAAIVRPGRRTARIRATLDATEDPVDVYRVWVAARGAVAVRVRGTSNVDLEAFRSTARTVFYRDRPAALRGALIGGSYRSGLAPDTAILRNPGRTGANLYLAVYKPARDATLDAAYTLTAAAR